MPKIKFTSGGKSVDLKSISWNRQTLYRVLSGLGYLTFLIYIAAIPVAFYMTKGVTEAILVQLTVYTALAMLFICLGMIVLAGSKILIDTPLLMTILLFALLTVGAYLMASTNVRNTFGLSAVKYLAGSLIMSSLGIYYFGALFTNTARKLNLLKYVLLLVPILLGLIYLTNLVIAVSSVRIVSLFIPVYLLGVLYLKDKGLRLVSLIGLIVSVIINLKYGFTSYISIAVICEFLMVLFMILWVKRVKVITEVQSSLKNLKLRESLPISVGFWIVLLLGIIYFVLTAVWNIQNHQIVTDFFKSVAQDFSDASLSLRSIVPALIGTGANLPISSTSYATELQFQGVLGLGGHILLAVGVIYLGGKTFYKYLRDQANNTGDLFILFPVFVGLAISATLSLLTQMESVIWWICLAVLCAEIVITQRSFVSNLLQKLNFKAFVVQKRVELVQVLLIVILAVVFVYLATLVNQQIVRGLL